MSETATVTIYIYLPNEGVDVWRPVEATKISNDMYRILSENQHPDDEHWEFAKGDIVRCEQKQLSRGLTLVAVESV